MAPSTRSLVGNNYENGVDDNIRRYVDEALVELIQSMEQMVRQFWQNQVDNSVVGRTPNKYSELPGVEFPKLQGNDSQLQNSYSNLYTGNDLSINDNNKEMTCEENKDACKVFEEMPIKKTSEMENGLFDFDVSWKDDVECEEMELRKSEMDDDTECMGVSVVFCDMFVQEEDEIVGNEERIDLGRLVYGDEGMKVNTSESFCLPFTKMKKVVKGKYNSLVGSKDEYSVEQCTSNEDNDLIVSDLVKYCDRRCFDGWADGYKSLYVATYVSDVHSPSDKTFTCDDQ